MNELANNQETKEYRKLYIEKINIDLLCNFFSKLQDKHEFESVLKIMLDYLISLKRHPAQRGLCTEIFELYPFLDINGGWGVIFIDKMNEQSAPVLFYSINVLVRGFTIPNEFWKLRETLKECVAKKKELIKLLFRTKAYQSYELSEKVMDLLSK